MASFRGLEGQPPCRCGEDLALTVEVENRSDADRQLELAVSASHRRSPRSAAGVQTALVKKGERKTFSFSLRIDLPCSDNYLLLRAQVLDRRANQQLGECTAWVPYLHAVPLTVTTDRSSYAPGQPIEGTVRWPRLGGDWQLEAYLVDHAGRAISGGKSSSSFIMPDGGPQCLGSYWVTVVARRGEQLLGMARVQVQLDRPWDMRRQFQWSVWTTASEPRGLALVRDAGFNELGMSGNSAEADRYAMRQYVESTGINTFGVTIDHDRWADVRAAMVKTIERIEQSGPDARSKSLVSLGEESGFAGGWGARYYWKEPQAPPLVQRVFDAYLAEIYAGNIAELNRQWGTAHGSFDQIPLEQAKVTSPGRIFTTSQAWEASERKEPAAGGRPVNVAKPDARQEFLARTAPYYETYRFFDWYYQKYCDLATDVYRASRNPVPRTILSAPGGFYPKVDVYNFGGQGPFYPKEAALVDGAIARRDYGDVPGFSAAMWAYFDLNSLWNCVVLSSILAGNTHIDYWVDVPLTFNADFTHTRASFWTKLLRRELAPIEPILLGKRAAATPGLGLYIPRQPLPKGLLEKHFGSAISPNAPVYSALEESGLQPRVVGAESLAGIQVLVASYAEVMGADDGRRLRQFVHDGGTLLCTPWFGGCSPHGNPLSVYPAPESGLADLLGFQLLNTSQQPVKEKEEVTVDLEQRFPGAGRLTLSGQAHDHVLRPAADVETLGRYKDGAPLLLYRNAGRGRVVYLNMIYDWSHWWASFHEPSREAYRKLLVAIVTSDGRVKPDYFIAFQSAEATGDNKGWWGTVMPTQPRPGESVPWWASQLYSDPSGTVHYLAVFSDERSPAITAQVRWARPGVRLFDLLHGGEIAATAGSAPLVLRPGEAAFWAITPSAPGPLKLSGPQEVRAGDPLKISVQLSGDPASLGHLGLVVDVYDPAGRRSAAHSLDNAVLVGGRADLEIPTALNDPAGTYRVVATESMTRGRAEARFVLLPAEGIPSPAMLNPFPARAGETWDPPPMTSPEFVDLVRKLRAVYLASYEGLEAKYALSYFLNVPFRPENRHSLVRRLQRTDWRPHLPAVVAALRAGEKFILVGEDMNLDPATGAKIDPLAVADPAAFLDALARAPGAVRRSVRAENFEFDVIGIGAGAVIVARTGVDRLAYHSSDFVRWHAAFKRALGTAGVAPGP